MSYNFFQNALDQRAVQQPYTPSVINNQSQYNASVNIGVSDEEKQYLKSQGFSDEEIMQAGQQQAPAPAPEQGFFSGALEKTGQAFEAGTSRIGEAISGVSSGKYKVDEAVGRGILGASEAAFSPLSGAIGQSIESFVPDSTKKAVGEFVAPKVQAVQDYRNAQSPSQQRNIDNLLVGLEVAANFLGVGGAAKVAGSEVAKTAVKETGKIIAKGATATGQGIIKGVKATGGAVASIPEYGISIATGLSKDAQTAIKSNPAIYKQARTGSITRDTIFDETKTALDKRISDLSELGRSYKDLRTGKVVANTDDLNTAFVNATKSVDNIDLPISDRNAIAEAKKYIDELQGDVTDRQLLAMRKKIDSTISYDKGVSSEGQAVVRGIRASIDDLAKSRIAGLAERDAKFAPEIQFLNTVKNSVYDAKGNIKDNAISAINSLTGKGKEFKIDRFEQVLPGITAKIKALKAFEEVQGIGEIKTGSIARQGGGIIAGTTAGGPIGAMIGFVLTHPGIASRVLESYGMAKSAISDIIAKKASKSVNDQALKIIKTAKLPEVEKIILKQQATKPIKSTPLIKPTQAKSGIVSAAKKLDFSKNNKGFINPTAIAEDLGLKKNSTKTLVEEAKKYKNAEEFKALGFDAILDDLRGVKRDSIVTIPTKDIKIKYKQDYDNAMTEAKTRSDYNPNTAEPVEFTYNIKTGKYEIEDGHHRYVSAKRSGNPLKGEITGITGNLEELANLYKKERGISIQDIYNQSKNTKGILDLTKSNKGFINPTAMAEDMGLKGKNSTKDLMEEAKKYGSAEEFVKAKEANGEVFYHGTNKDFHFSEFNETKRGALGETGRNAYFLTNDTKEAMIYAKEAVFQNKNGEPTIKKLILGTKNIKKLPEGQSTAKTDRLELARKEGYDAVIDDRGNIAVFDKKFIIEPTDIYNQSKALIKK